MLPVYSISIAHLFIEALILPIGYNCNMSLEIPINASEKKETLDDNARKFLITNFDPQLLVHSGSVSYNLTADWLETGETTEVKVAHKTFDNGDVKILLISKVQGANGRTSDKQKIDQAKYEELLASSLKRVEKRRHEFEYFQNGTLFKMNYDDHSKAPLTVLEVDASSDIERESFDPLLFPATLVDVTGQEKYYGYRVATTINELAQK